MRERTSTFHAMRVSRCWPNRCINTNPNIYERHVAVNNVIQTNIYAYALYIIYIYICFEEIPTKKMSGKARYILLSRIKLSETKAGGRSLSREIYHIFPPNIIYISRKMTPCHGFSFSFCLPS